MRLNQTYIWHHSGEWLGGQLMKPVFLVINTGCFSFIWPKEQENFGDIICLYLYICTSINIYIDRIKCYPERIDNSVCEKPQRLYVQKTTERHITNHKKLKDATLDLTDVIDG